MAIALFYAISTGIGGAVGPLLFGNLLGGGRPDAASPRLLDRVGADGRGVRDRLGVGRRRRAASLEEIAEPLSAASAEAA